MAAASRSCASPSKGETRVSCDARFARMVADLHVAAKAASARFARLVPNRPLVAAGSL